jgi:hypothetical protein
MVPFLPVEFQGLPERRPVGLRVVNIAPADLILTHTQDNVQSATEAPFN